MSEQAFNGTVKEGWERKYTVINENDRKKYLKAAQNGVLEEALNYYLGKIEDGRAKDGKKPYNNYIVINLDEPYVDEVIEILEKNGHWGGRKE